VELDSKEDRVVGDGAGMGGTRAKRLPISFSGSANVCGADRVERNQIDRVDLEVGLAHRIHAADSDHRPLPEAKGHRDAAVDDFVAELSTELHVVIIAGR
jgi:hypothetical protein